MLNEGVLCLRSVSRLTVYSLNPGYPGAAGRARSQAEADAAAKAFVLEIATIRELNGPIVWTVHNELPYEIPHHRQFLVMRRALAWHADAILLHNVNVLAAQVSLDPLRVNRLPHPSYLGRHENEATLQAGLLSAPHERRIECFGWIRFRKGFGQMIGMLPADHLQSRGATCG